MAKCRTQPHLCVVTCSGLFRMPGNQSNFHEENLEPPNKCSYHCARLFSGQNEVFFSATQSGAHSLGVQHKGTDTPTLRKVR